MKIQILAAFGLVLSFCLCSSINAKDDQKIFRKAQQYEKNGHYETAIAAYEILVKHYSGSAYYSKARQKVASLRDIVENRRQKRVTKIASIQKPNLRQGRTVKTALEKGVELTTTQERKLEELTVELMKSFNETPTSNLPEPDSRSSSVPIPCIEKVYYPPIGKVGKPIFVKILGKNLGKSARQGGITISFPDKPDYITVLQSREQSTKITLYRQGEKLYSGARGVYIISEDPMIETYQWSSIPKGGRYSLSTILIPDQSGVLRLYIRSALRGQGDNFYNYPSQGPLDQQSYNVLEYIIYIED